MGVLVALALVRLLGAMPQHGAVLLAGQALLVIGGLSNLAHFAILKRAAGSLGEPSRLVTRGGLLGVLRHPMYLGDVVMAGGLACVAQGVAAVVAWCALTIAVVAAARREDADMARRFGAEFEVWRARTGLLIPRLSRPSAP